MASIELDSTPPEETTANVATDAPQSEPEQAAVVDGSPIFQLPCIDERERALPIRQGDLTRLLLAEPDLSPEDRPRLEAFGQFLGATFHSEYYDRLRELKELYAPLDPDSDYVTIKDHSHPLTPHCDESFLARFEELLDRANYQRLDLKIIKEAVAAPNEMGLTYIPDFSLFEHLKVWVRGYTQITRDRRTIRSRFRKQRVRLDAYQRLVVALKFKSDQDIGPFVRSDVLYLRMFKDVPHVDMEMHLPEQATDVRMRWIDKAQIASPVVASIPTILAKIFLLTMTPAVTGGLIFGSISACINAVFGFHRARHKHLSAMIQRLYYLTLANNACVLNRLVDSAEDEDYKETMLAFYFLWKASAESKPLTVPELDARIESYLKQRTHIEVNFEVADALGKLFSLGLARRDSQARLHALPIEQALQTLDRRWDDKFRYS